MKNIISKIMQWFFVLFTFIIIFEYCYNSDISWIPNKIEIVLDVLGSAYIAYLVYYGYKHKGAYIL